MKLFKRISLLTLILTFVLSLASCSTRLSGTYTSSASETNYMTESFIFEDNSVKRTQSLGSSGSFGGSEITGTYDISYAGVSEGYEITFVWDAVGSYVGKTEQERTETYFFKKTSNYIQIGDKKYEKQ